MTEIPRDLASFTDVSSWPQLNVPFVRSIADHEKSNRVHFAPRAFIESSSRWRVASASKTMSAPSLIPNPVGVTPDPVGDVGAGIGTTPVAPEVATVDPLAFVA